MVRPCPETTKGARPQGIGEAYCSTCGKDVTVYHSKEKEKWVCPHCGSAYDETLSKK